MRSATWARWATCAIAISICVPAFAEQKSLSTCTSFDQADSGEDLVQLTIHNSCSVPIDCSITWRVVCAPESKKRRATHSGAAKLALRETTAASTMASAAVCGDDAWAIDTIQWTCQPNKD